MYSGDTDLLCVNATSLPEKVSRIKKSENYLFIEFCFVNVREYMATVFSYLVGTIDEWHLK